MHKFLISLLLINFFSSHGEAQQNYSDSSALDCNSNDKAGPSPALLYTCNGQHQTCPAFLIFKSQPSFDSVPTISTLTSASQEDLARVNNVTRLHKFPVGKEVLVPVTCSCLGKYYQANTTFYVTETLGTYYVIALNAYEGLSTCAALTHANPQSELHLFPGLEIQVPLRCACPTANQIKNGTNYLLTFPLNPDDNIPDIADRFGLSEHTVLDANGLRENPTLITNTTILIPLPTPPTSSQTIIQNNTEEIPPPTPLTSINRKSKRKLFEYAGIAAACSLLLLIIVIVNILLLCNKIKRKAREKATRSKQVGNEDLRVEIASCEQVFKVYRIQEVKKATNNFSTKNIIKGSVYHGDFGGLICIVKKMKKDVSKEVNMLQRINHLNLIKPQGFCEDRGSFYLVFEYMRYGSLKEWLSAGKSSKDIESWFRRIQIALDVANGLYYLHSFTEPAYVHKDIKSSNILLNGEVRAKIANFSLARAATDCDDATTKNVVGTRGYMAPEYLTAGQVSPKIDVYAFGVVLLELITGKDAVLVQNGRESLLSNAVMSIIKKENAEAELRLIVDPSLERRHGTEFALRLAKISVACLAKEPSKRPSMEEVVSILLKIQADLWKSESLNVKSIDEEFPLWCSATSEEHDCRVEAI
ncbi:hypothetical protein Tsubulata_037289 [Turnera subulata]|uniref:Protein kinase domain-containing protein n=1 Tax=Turnera subulata TaxID=218843 RepID=A0A9Q0FAY1_9ROSI|nr:hypothetical protein Tsubulata_037289 [Turnera subulata]